MKKCSNCQCRKQLSEFHKNKSHRDGLNNICKECKTVLSKKYRGKNEIKTKKIRRDSYHKNKSKDSQVKRKRSLKFCYSQYKSQAKVRQIEFGLTLNEFKEFWQQPCVWCGSEIATIGLDRIDSAQGYSLNNIQSMCKICNYIKLNYDEEFILDKIFQILKHQKII